MHYMFHFVIKYNVVTGFLSQEVLMIFHCYYKNPLSVYPTEKGG